MTPAIAVLAIIGAYVLGSVPFSLLLGYLLKGVDIRTQGSGNVGATNLGRVCGWRFFPLAFALDCAKGLAPLLVARPFLDAADMPRPALLAVTVLLALAPVLGHLFSPFLRFSGGKGVATTAGALAALLPLETAVVVGVWLLVFALTRTVGVASSAAAVALPPAFFLCTRHACDELVLYGTLCVLLAALVLYRHRGNLQKYFTRLRTP